MKRDDRSDRELADGNIGSLYDILVAWQAGRLPYRRALSLTGIRSLPELYEAAANSDIALRTKLLPHEARAAKRAIDALKPYGPFKLSKETKNSRAG